MLRDRWMAGVAIRFLVFGGVLLCGWRGAMAQPKNGTVQAQAPGAAASLPQDSRLVETREQLLSYLRMSPTLATVMASDPTLLADQEYIARSNPELARFLEAHPEVVHNPEFYLFADIPAG